MPDFSSRGLEAPHDAHHPNVKLDQHGPQPEKHYVTTAPCLLSRGWDLIGVFFTAITPPPSNTISHERESGKSLV